MALKPPVTFDPSNEDDVYIMVRMLMDLRADIDALQSCGSIEKCHEAGINYKRDRDWPQMQALERWVKEKQNG